MKLIETSVVASAIVVGMTTAEKHEALRKHWAEFRERCAGMRVRYYYHREVRGCVLHVRSGVIRSVPRYEWSEDMQEVWCDA